MKNILRMTIIYGDRYDTIFHISNGLVPKRNPHFNWSLVVPGDTSATLWTKYQPESALPQVLNPDCGYVFNMNNSPFECTGPSCNPNIKDYDPTMGFDMKKTNRSERMYQLMDQLGKKKMSWDDFLRIKYDDQLPDSLVFQNGIDLNRIFKLDVTKYPDIADALDNIKTCQRTGDTTNIKVTILVEAVYNIFNNQGKFSNDYAHDTAAQDSLFVTSIRQAKAEMVNYFGTINVALGRIQKLVRGNKVLAVPGLPDVITACYTQPWKDGMRKMVVGESYIQLVKFNKTGLPQIQSISAFGASSHVDNPHGTDQMEMFVHKQLKTESLDKKYVYKHAERIYHPGI
jgi:acyl-homoserine-lactone acylase